MAARLALRLRRSRWAPHSIKAVYGGDSNFAGSTSKAVKQVVNKATTTTTLTSSQNPSNFGQSVTFTASVAPQFSGNSHRVSDLLRWHDGPEDCGSERRRGKVHNLDADLGRAHHHGNVQRQHQLYRQFGFADTDGELGNRGLGFGLLRDSSARPIRVKSATSFYAAFRACFASGGDGQPVYPPDHLEGEFLGH